MTKYIAGKWPAHNTTAIINNVKLVFRSRDIGKLNGTAYKFIILHMGFIAHYNLQGFQQSYANLNQFARALQTSEYSDNLNYNLRAADRTETDADFNKWYGAAYNDSVAATVRGIVNVAQAYLSGAILGRGSIRYFHAPQSRRRVDNPVQAMINRSR